MEFARFARKRNDLIGGSLQRKWVLIMQNKDSSCLFKNSNGV